MKPIHGPIGRVLDSLLILGAVGFVTGLSLAQDTYDDYLKQQQAEFRRFISEQDIAFADFLEMEWKEFRSSQGLARDTVSKPDVPPIAEPSPMPDLVPILEIPAEPSIQELIRPVIPMPAPKPESDQPLNPGWVSLNPSYSLGLSLHVFP